MNQSTKKSLVSRSFVQIFVLSIFASVSNVAAWTVAPKAGISQRLGPLFHAPPSAPKHDVGENSMANFTPEQLVRAKAYMEHQQNVPKPGFPVDVRSLIQYNHGFAVMSTNSKS
jgi:hypothetical protein